MAPRGGTITGAGSRPTLNEANQIGTILTIDDTIASAARIDGTTVHELVRQGDLLADGITTVGQFRSMSGFINSTGQVAFAADYTQPSKIGQAPFWRTTVERRLLRDVICLAPPRRRTQCTSLASVIRGVFR